MMPKFQNIYGNREGESMSWGGLLETPTNFDPVSYTHLDVYKRQLSCDTIGASSIFKYSVAET